MAGIVEAQTVDQRPVFEEAEQAGLGIAGLGQWRQCSEFNKAEAEGKETAGRLGILVETGGDTDRIGKGQVPKLDFQRIGLKPFRQEAPFKCRKGQKVRAFRWKHEQKRTEQAIGPHGRASSLRNSSRPESGISRTHKAAEAGKGP